MKKIKLNDKVYDLPQDWSEISLGKFQELTRIMEKNLSIPAEEVDGILQMECAAEVISTLTDCPLDELLRADINSISKVSELIAWTGHFDEDSLNSGRLSDVRLSGSQLSECLVFTIDKREYVFDYSMALSFGQMIDIETLSNHPGGRWENAHKLIAILVRPAKRRSVVRRAIMRLSIGRLMKREKMKIVPSVMEGLTDFVVDKYDWASVEERGRIFQDRISAYDAMRIAFFLAGLKLISTELMQASLEGEAVPQPSTGRPSTKSGGGGL